LFRPNRARIYSARGGYDVANRAKPSNNSSAATKKVTSECALELQKKRRRKKERNRKERNRF
jgi:hypothetical protein